MYFFYFYPVGTNRQQNSQPVLTWAIMLSMVVAFLWYKYFPHLLSIDPENLVFYPGSGRPWTVLTAVFMHGGWLHLVGNLIYFNVFGPILESRVGHGMFVFYFLVMGIFGNLVHGLVASQGWFGQYGVGVLGASGAIAGLLAFSLIRFHNAKVDIAWWVFAPLVGQNRAGRTKVPLQLAVAMWLALQVVHSLVASQTGASVSYGAHFGGFFMGLSLALAMGQWREGHQEGLRDKAAEYFRDGAYYASAGVWVEYLALAPMDLQARLGLARAQVLCGQASQAEENFRQVFARFLLRGKIDSALAVFREAGRAGLVESFSPKDLAKIAFYQEKKLDYAEAAKTFVLLFELYPQSHEGQRALVRLVMLHRGKIPDPAALLHWREVAHETLPRGGWRKFLDEEFRKEGGLGANVGKDHHEDLLSIFQEEPSPPEL